MAKTKSTYVCQNCGANSPKWIGKCPSCQEWNSYVEEIIYKDSSSTKSSIRPASVPKPVSEIDLTGSPRIDTHCSELNRVLGGGLVPGSVVLIGGEPGIGKSTLMLQVALTNPGLKTLYISGEESPQQIRLRAERTGKDGSQCFILCETNLEDILGQIDHSKPDLVIIDSIQTLQTERAESSPGSVTQVRECTSSLLRKAKDCNIPVILIGHINKDGHIAGPKVLEHIVDTVLQFEGDRNHIYRILRSAKNRFGSTSELGIFEMRNDGLHEVLNPSELLLSQSDEDLSGTAVAATVDGARPFLIEVQALVSSAVYGNPQRTCTGFDQRRLNMLLAVLEKRAGFRLATKDVFLNIAGGIRVDDPAIDLAVISSILSSNQNLSVNKSYCFAGEIGLTGEIRPVNRIEQRLSEAARLGFQKIFLSRYNKKGINVENSKIEICFVSRVDELVKQIFA